MEAEGKGKRERERRQAGELAPQTQKPNSAYGLTHPNIPPDVF
jgi:hypothetical protein